MTRNQQTRGDRWVITLHKVADVMVEIATEVSSGKTRLRRPYPGRHLSLDGEVTAEVPRV